MSKHYGKLQQPLKHVITVIPVITKTFDTMEIHELIDKIIGTNITNTNIAFIATYFKGENLSITITTQHLHKKMAHSSR